MKNPILTVIATGFGTGFSPLAPGTAGSLAAALIFLAVSAIGPFAPWMAFAALIPLAFAGAAHGERMWGHDPSRVTIDEIAGCWSACLAAPHGIGWLLAAVLLFRFFDILKPWPVSVFDGMRGSAGVVLDDLAAGAMAAALLCMAGGLTGAR